jgi:hypothetical protein
LITRMLFDEKYSTVVKIMNLLIMRFSTVFCYLLFFFQWFDSPLGA